MLIFVHSASNFDGPDKGRFVHNRILGRLAMENKVRWDVNRLTNVVQWYFNPVVIINGDDFHLFASNRESIEQAIKNHYPQDMREEIIFAYPNPNTIVITCRGESQIATIS